MAERSVEISLSEQAEAFCKEADLDEEKLVDFIADQGFTIGGKEALKYIVAKQNAVGE